MTWSMLPLILLTLFPLAEPPCPEGVVSHVFVDNHSIFDAPSLPDNPRVRWIYRAANRIHVRTRPSFIRGEVLLGPGDCLNEALVAESARILRSFQFIADADVFGVRQPDGTHHLIVETRDEWTTKTAGDVSFRGGIRLTEFSVVEENLFGRGLTLGVFMLDDEVVRERGGLLRVPRVGRRNWDLDLSAARTRVGTSWKQGWVHPFMGEVGTLAFRQSAQRTAGEFAWVLPRGSQNQHLVAPIETGGAEVVLARRIGTPGSYLVVGGGWSREWMRPGDRTQIEGVRRGDFDVRYPVDPQVQRSLEEELTHRDVDRLHWMGGVRRVRYVSLRNLDAIAGLQDVPLGTELLVSVSPTLVVREGGHDRLLRGELFWGAHEAPFVVQARAVLEGRDRPTTVESPGTEGRFHDVIAGAYLLVYRVHEAPSSRTQVVRVGADGGWQTKHPFQLTLGGPSGVRGLDLHDEPGSRRIVVSIEDRIRLRSPLPDMFDLGTTLFMDAGRILPGQRPWEEDSGWRTSLGIGLRLGFPAGSASVIRMDIAVPMQGSGRRPVVNIHARDWLGLEDALRRLDLDRSRWHGVGLRFPGVAQRGPSR